MVKDIKRIKNWSLNPLENVSVGDFNNVTDINKRGVFPGKNEADSAFTVKNNNFTSVSKIKFYPENYSFYIMKGGYFYGITADNKELIAITEDKDVIIPVTEGAGGFLFKNGDKTVFSTDEVVGYTAFEENGVTKLCVNYKAFGDFKTAPEVYNLYTFNENFFSVDAKIRVIGLGSADYTKFLRKHTNSYSEYTKRVSFNWEYPENGDFEYKSFDAVVVSENYGNYEFFTALRDENSDKKVFIREVNPESFEVYPKIDCDTEYKCHIDFAVVPKNYKSAYKGLFLTRGSNFSAGIASVSETDNTAFFIGKNIDLNLNVSNISQKSICFTSKYELIDYYGEKIESKTFYGNKLEIDGEANHNICLTVEKYGMYFLNFYVTDGNYEYKETYPFALIEDYDFKYRKSSPFGICATHCETLGEARSTARICGKIGLGFTRDGRSAFNNELHKFLKENGVNSYSGVSQDTQDPAGIVWANNEDDVERMMAEVKKSAENFDDDSYGLYFVANEIDGPTKANYEKSLKVLNEKFIPYTYKPIYDYIKENYPKALKKMIWESNCHGTTEWLEAFYETGMWDNSEIIDIHSYSSPSGPDKVYSNMRESMHANTFSNEYAMDRWKRIQKRYGKKRMIVGETGYPAAPYIGNRCEADPRTVADFNVRIAMFMLEAKAELVLYYSIFDRTRNFIGGGSWNEMYFGACYNYDYYGVYQPKPWAAAFANLTRRLDGVKKVSYFDKYEESEFGDLRAFRVETEDKEFAVLWSNKYKQPNTTAIGRINKTERIPDSLWTNRWIETDKREFDAVGEVVTVVDIMGNSKEIKTSNGKVTLELTGSPVYVYGIK